MVAPALGHMAQDLGITNTVVESMTLSIFLLAYAIGPLMLGPLSEIYGRVIVLQTSNLLYLVFNLACGFAQTPAQMIVFRFFSGLGGSAPLAIGGGVLSDLFNAEQRGRAISIYSLAPLLGPVSRCKPIRRNFICTLTFRGEIDCSFLEGFLLGPSFHALIQREILQRRAEKRDSLWPTVVFQLKILMYKAMYCSSW